MGNEIVPISLIPLLVNNPIIKAKQDKYFYLYYNKSEVGEKDNFIIQNAIKSVFQALINN